MQSQISAIAGKLLQDLQRHIDKSAATQATVWIDARMLILDIVSLNLFTFISYPLVKPMLGDLTADKDSFMKKRKAENVEIIMRRLKRTEP